MGDSKSTQEALLDELEQASQTAREAPEEGVEVAVADDSAAVNRPGRWRRLTPWLGGAIVGGVIALLLAFSLVFTASKSEHPRPELAERIEPAAPPSMTALSASGGDRDQLLTRDLVQRNQAQVAEFMKRKQQADISSNRAVTSSAPGSDSSSSNATGALPTPPMIIRTAQITVVAQNFDKARSDIDQIVRTYGGYLGDLSVSARADGPRKLTATLRVPANRLDAALAEVKKLGHVESESQNGEDVTAQYVDLEARLSNARNTEQRLLDLLRQRTGQLSDVLEVETELSRVREEIERMEGERRLLARQVSFSTITATVTEVYKAPAGALPDSLRTRFRNAAVEGYQSVVNFFVNVALFLLSNGLLLLLWAAILYYPARWIWRRMRAD